MSAYLSSKPEPREPVRGDAGLRPDASHATLAVLFMLALLATSVFILRPFLFALFWSTMIVVATWPLMLLVQARVRRRWLAVTVMTGTLLLAFIVPLALAIATLAANAEEIAAWVQSIRHASLPQPPGVLESVPVVGQKIASRWRELASSGPEELAATLDPYVANAARWVVTEAGSVGAIILQALLTVVISAVLFTHGEVAAAAVQRFLRRVAGERGDDVVRAAREAIRGIALGVVGIGILGGVVGGVGLALAQVPFVALLTAVMILLGIAQIGPAPVLIGATAWLYWKGDSLWGTVLLAWTVLVWLLDNVGRPLLIQRVGRMPLLLVLVGVLGGMLAFGMAGLFIGPVVLAMTYRYMASWMREDAAAK